MEDDELKTILGSARAFYHGTIEKSAIYLSPDEYEDMESGNDSGKKPVTSDTIKQILQKMSICVRLNQITGKVEIEGMPPQYSKGNAANVLPVLVNDYLTKRRMACVKQTLDDCLVLIEDENRYNPVEKMFKSTQYDGIDRLKELAEILGIAGNKTYVLRFPDR